MSRRRPQALTATQTSSVVAMQRPRDRLAGAAMGLVVAAICTGAGAPLVVGAFDLEVGDLLIALTAPTLITGALVGWCFAPLGVRVTEWTGLVGLGLVMALAATSVGAMLVGFMMGAGSTTPPGGPAASLVQGLLFAFFLWPFGVLSFGEIAMPVTFVAGVVWVLLMRLWSDVRAR